MYKRIVRITLTMLLAVLMAACTSHKRPPCGPGAMDPSMYGGGPGGRGVYTEGMRPGDEAYEESNNPKCRPGKPLPRHEQHYFFNYDSNEVRPDAVDSIRIQANYLLKHPDVHIRLEGNADDRGSREYNIALGERRARAILDVLKQLGVSSQQISVISFGAEKPAVSGDSEKSYQCNRRVDLKYAE